MACYFQALLPNSLETGLTIFDCLPLRDLPHKQVLGYGGIGTTQVIKVSKSLGFDIADGFLIVL